MAGAFLLPLAFVASPARAETAIYYSAPENAYGWCAGYSLNRARSCAKGYCADEGGTDCNLAVECGGGWGAIAFAERPAEGFGASCGMADALAARAVALSNCMAVSNTMCWTDVAFNANGRTSSEASNRDFDITWYSQGMLQVRNYDPGTADGNFGRQTRSAISEFQTDLGRTATGDLDDELFFRLLDAVGGAQNLARIVKRDVVEPKQEELAENVYSYSRLPAQPATFSEELMTRPLDQRLLALATLLASSNTKCTLPALDGQPLPDASSGIWSIECVEGSYTLILGEDGSRTIMSGGSSEEPEPSKKVPPEPSAKVQP